MLAYSFMTKCYIPTASKTVAPLEESKYILSHSNEFGDEKIGWAKLEQMKYTGKIDGVVE